MLRLTFSSERFYYLGMVLDIKILCVVWFWGVEEKRFSLIVYASNTTSILAHTK